MIAFLTTTFKGESNTPFAQFVRHTLMGGIAFLVDFTTLFVLYRLCGLHYLLAAAIGFLCGLTTIYFSCVCYVFDQRAVKNPIVEFTLFAILGAIGLGITLGTMALLTGMLAVPVLVSKIVAAGITFVWNFLSRKLLLFTPMTPATA